MIPYSKGLLESFFVLDVVTAGEFLAELVLAK